MAFLNRCVWTAASAGLGDFVVSAPALNGYTPFQCTNPALVNGALYHYFATSGNDHEEGDGTFTGNTLARTTIRNSTNGGAKVNFSAAPIVSMGGPVSGDFITSFTVATLPATHAGIMAYVTDGLAAQAFGAVVLGSSTTPYLVWYNGTNWTIVGK